MPASNLQRQSPEDILYAALRAEGNDLTKGGLKLFLSGYLALRDRAQNNIPQNRHYKETH